MAVFSPHAAQPSIKNTGMVLPQVSSYWLSVSLNVRDCVHMFETSLVRMCVYRCKYIQSTNMNMCGCVNTVYTCPYVYIDAWLCRRRGLSVSISTPVCACECVCMNNSRHAMLSAEASAPDRGWNIYANVVGRGLMRDHRRRGEREKTVKNWWRSHFKTDFMAAVQLFFVSY